MTLKTEGRKERNRNQGPGLSGYLCRSRLRGRNYWAPSQPPGGAPSSQGCKCKRTPARRGSPAVCPAPEPALSLCSRGRPPGSLGSRLHPLVRASNTLTSQERPKPRTARGRGRTRVFCYFAFRESIHSAPWKTVSALTTAFTL